MQKRREFIRNSALCTSFLAGTTQYLLSEDKGADSSKNLSRPACQIPVIYEVDVAIVGGGCAAVATAVSAKKENLQVFLMAEEPYLGEDLCGTMRYHEAWSQSAPDFLKPLYDKVAKPNPMDYKAYLDECLMSANVPFLLMSHPSRVLFDEMGKVAGLVLVNRSGEQIVRCKSIVDASPNGSVLKAAGVPFLQRNEQPYVEFTVLGDEKRPTDKLVREIETSFDGKSYLYSTYRFDGMRLESKQDQAVAESLVRGKTWFPSMMDAADRCFYPPAFKVDVEAQAGVASAKCKSHADIYALNGFGIVEPANLIEALKPAAMIDLGTALGKAMAPEVKSKKWGKLVVQKNDQKQESIVLSKFSIVRNELEVLSMPSEALPILATFDVLVVGGGTAGAAAGVGAAEAGAKTLVIEPLHGLGGTGTLGMVSIYYHGYEAGFNKRVDVGTRDIGADDPRGKKINYTKTWINSWKMEWYRREIEKFGGQIWFGTTACGAVLKGKSVQGVVVGTSFGKGIVLAKKVIDATGSSDIAIAAGADYTYTNQDHAAIQGSGVPGLSLKREYYNTDWTFITEYDAFDTTRALTLSKPQLGKGLFDAGKLVQTRERRRIVGDYTINAMDIIHNHTYEDAISYHKSNFDSHGYTVDPFFQLKPPHKNSLEASVPLRCLRPVGLEDIVVTGLGFSAHRDAMPVLRMQRCLQNQGYALGLLAAYCVTQNKNFREIDLKPIQIKLKEIGILPSRLSLNESKPVEESALDKVIEKLDMKLEGLEVLLLNPTLSFEKLKTMLKASDQLEQRQAASFILGMYHHAEGEKELSKMVSAAKTWDKGWNYRGMGQFGASTSPLDNLIIALGRTGQVSAIDHFVPLAQQLDADSEFSHFRAIAIACESIKSPKAAPILAELLLKLGDSHVTTSLAEAKSKMIVGKEDNLTRNNALKELVVSRALFRCGDVKGLAELRLKAYSKDLRGHFALHASSILKSMTS